jgi:hypothetical protein
VDRPGLTANRDSTGRSVRGVSDGTDRDGDTTGAGADAGAGAGAGEKKTEAESVTGAPAMSVSPSIATENPKKAPSDPSASVSLAVCPRAGAPARAKG